MFPVRLGRRIPAIQNSDRLEEALLDILDRNLEPSKIKNEKVAAAFFEYLNELKISLESDIEAIYEGDPAAKTKNEIILAYPGFLAIACYRISHYLLLQGVGLLPRIITEYAHAETGIDIHPGAHIGKHFCIDHGTGVVIGETAVIGDGVKIYQGVTLGALSVPNRECCDGQRHPTIGNNVVIYAQAIILGGDTHIGDRSIIGGNVWITKSVSADSRIYFDNTGSTTFKTS